MNDKCRIHFQCGTFHFSLFSTSCDILRHPFADVSHRLFQTGICQFDWFDEVPGQAGAEVSGCGDIDLEKEIRLKFT